MKCKNCGYEGEGKFCPKCGKPLNGGKIYAGGTTNTNNKSILRNDPVNDARRRAITKNVFAIIGFVLSLISILACWVPIGGLVVIIPAIVLSILGFGALTKKGFAEAGLIISIICTPVNLAMTIYLLSVF